MYYDQERIGYDLMKNRIKQSTQSDPGPPRGREGGVPPLSRILTSRKLFGSEYLFSFSLILEVLRTQKRLNHLHFLQKHLNFF